MTQDIENFFEIEKKDIIECGILHWSNYKKDLPKRTMKDKIIISFFLQHHQILKILMKIY